VDRDMKSRDEKFKNAVSELEAKMNEKFDSELSTMREQQNWL